MVTMEKQYGLSESARTVAELPESNWEDIHSKRLMDSASRHVTEGRFEQARLQLEVAQRLCSGTKGLAELLAIAEVCLAAVGRPCPCQSRRHKFPDWYHILKVDEKADISLIKKRYRQLALLLHPDKNTHVKAEGAFKYISQAYDCLSDKNKRISFNLERARSLCRRCSTTSEANDSIPRGSDFRKSFQQEHGFGASQEYRYGTSELAWESVRLQTFRRKARARAEAAGSDLGSRLWKWNKEFEKLNIKRNDKCFEKREMTSNPHRHLDETRTSSIARSNGFQVDGNKSPEKKSCESQLIDFTSILRRSRESRKESGGVARTLDDLLTSLRSGKGERKHIDTMRRSTTTGFGPGKGCHERQSRYPTTEDIIKYFRDPQTKPCQPRNPAELLELDNSSLKEIYFPSPKGLPSDVRHYSPVDDKTAEPYTSPPQSCRVLPEKDLSRLESCRLLKNLDAALADISRSTVNAKFGHSIPMIPLFKTGRKISHTDFPTRAMENGSPFSKLLESDQSTRKATREARGTVSGDPMGAFSSCCRQYRQTFNCCGGQPLGSTRVTQIQLENDSSMYITPLLRRQAGKNISLEGFNPATLTESRGTIDPIIEAQPANDRGMWATNSTGNLSNGPVATTFLKSETVGESSTRSFRDHDKVASSAAVQDFSSQTCSRKCYKSGLSPLSPLLSSEKLGIWIDSLTSSSHLSLRGVGDLPKDGNVFSSESENKPHGTHLCPSEIGTESVSWKRLRNQLEAADFLPSSVSSKHFGTLPEYNMLRSQKGAPDVHNVISSVATNLYAYDGRSGCSVKFLGLEDSCQSNGSEFLQAEHFTRDVAHATAIKTPLEASDRRETLNFTEGVDSTQLPSSGSKIRASGSQISNLSTTTSAFSWATSRSENSVHIDPVVYTSELHTLAESANRSSENYELDQNLLSGRLQKSDELMETLERLREEAKTIAATLENYNETSRSKKAAALLGVCSNGLPKCQRTSPCLTV